MKLFSHDQQRTVRQHRDARKPNWAIVPVHSTAHQSTPGAVFKRNLDERITEENQYLRHLEEYDHVGSRTEGKQDSNDEHDSAGSLRPGRGAIEHVETVQEPTANTHMWAI